MKLVHLQTIIQTQFGLLDDDGNAIPQEPITATVQRFGLDDFREAHDVIAAARDKALASSETPAPPPKPRPQRTRPKR